MTCVAAMMHCRILSFDSGVHLAMSASAEKGWVSGVGGWEGLRPDRGVDDRDTLSLKMHRHKDDCQLPFKKDWKENPLRQL